MVKRCQWGLCNSDSRYKDRLVGNVTFIPFPKPKRKLEKCKRWIKACGRPHSQLNLEKIDGNYHMFVCSKHFPEGGPSEQYPDPFPANPVNVDKYTPARKPPKKRPATEPPKKRRKLLSDLDVSCKENHKPIIQEENFGRTSFEFEQIPDTASTSCDTFASKEFSSLDVLAIVAENQSLQQQLAKQVLLNEELRRHKAGTNSETQKSCRTCKRNFSVETFETVPLKTILSTIQVLHLFNLWLSSRF